MHQEHKLKYLLLIVVSIFLVSGAYSQDCNIDKDQEKILKALFSQPENIYSLLWWDDPEGNMINARSFIINGHDSIPIFATEAEAKAQIAGSGYEKDLVSVKPGLLAGILQGIDYAILNTSGELLQFNLRHVP